MSIKYYRYFIIYLFLKFISIKNYEIIIPFNSSLSKIKKDLTPLKFIQSLINNNLYININIGTPPQNIQFLLDFNNYDSYIVYKSKYDNYSSSSFNKINIQNNFYSSDYSYSYLASDIISFNEKNNISNFSFIFNHVIKPKNDPFINNAGILGFGVGQLRNVKYKDSLLDQLKRKNYINNYQFILVFNNEDFNGKIILDKNIYEEYPEENLVYDYSIFTNDYTYIFSWGWEYIILYYNNDLLEIKNIFLKPEFGAIIASDKIKNIFFNNFFKSKIDQKICNEYVFENYYYFYCEKNININEFSKLEFFLKRKNMNFTLDSNDLFYEYNNKIYFLIIFKNDVKVEDIYLGYPFFKKYNTLFNPDSKIVGFYNTKIDYNIKEKHETNKYKNILEKNDNNNIWKIILIFGLIFGIVIILFLSFYIYRDIKRKSKGKLFEELNP